MSDKLFVLNPKCVVISGIGVSMFYLYPTRDSPNHLLWATLLAAGIYVGIAWYDTVYDCEEKNAAGGIFTEFFQVFKPEIGSDGRYGSTKI